MRLTTDAFVLFVLDFGLLLISCGTGILPVFIIQGNLILNNKYKQLQFKLIEFGIEI